MSIRTPNADALEYLSHAKQNLGGGARHDNLVLKRITYYFEYRRTLRQISSVRDKKLSDFGINRSHIEYAARGTVLARDEYACCGL